MGQAVFCHALTPYIFFCFGTHRVFLRTPGLSQSLYIHKILFVFFTGLSSFAPCWEIPCERENLGEDETFLNMVFSLGMVELVSYWKTACPKEVIVEPWGLSEEQVSRIYGSSPGIDDITAVVILLFP